MADEKKSGGGHPFLILIGIIVLVFLIRGQGGLSNFISTPDRNREEKVLTRDEQISEIEDKIEDIEDVVEKLTESVYKGEIRLRKTRASKSRASQEYVEIQASGRLDGAVDVFGWQLLNVTAGTKIVLDNSLRIKDDFGNIGHDSVFIRENQKIVLYTSRDPIYERDDYRGFIDDYEWYIYAGARRELWQEDDRVLLLDKEGKRVDEIKV